jgi:hypothetical protein
VPADATFVASLRFTTALHLRIDEIMGNEEDAARSARALNGMLVMARAVTNGTQSDPMTPEAKALKEFGDSISIVQEKDRVALTATVPAGALKGLGAQ